MPEGGEGMGIPSLNDSFRTVTYLVPMGVWFVVWGFGFLWIVIRRACFGCFGFSFFSWIRIP